MHMEKCRDIDIVYTPYERIEQIQEFCLYVHVYTFCDISQLSLLSFSLILV